VEEDGVFLEKRSKVVLDSSRDVPSVRGYCRTGGEKRKGCKSAQDRRASGGGTRETRKDQNEGNQLKQREQFKIRGGCLIKKRIEKS